MDKIKVESNKSKKDLIKEADSLLKRKKKVGSQKEDSDNDSSDEELLVRTGNVPRKWYDDYDHSGYDIDAKKVIKPKEEDEVDKFLSKAESKNWWRNIYDEMNNKTIYISDKDLEMIKRIRKQMFANKEVEKEEYFERDIPRQIHPLSNHLPSKKTFNLSANERKVVNRIIYAIKNGFIKLDDELIEDKEVLYDIWAYENTDPAANYHPGLGFQAPKREHPDSELSYNPPKELLSDNMQIFDSIRKIPKYAALFDENVERFTDLVMSARIIRKRQDIREEDILPHLPKPEELKPFPTKETIIYKGHTSSIRAIAVDPKGKFLVSGDNAGFVYFWDIHTGKIIKKIDVSDNIQFIVFNHSLNLITVCGKENLYFILPPYLEKKLKLEILDLVDQKIKPLINEKQTENEKLDEKTIAFEWKLPKDDSIKYKQGILFYMKWKDGSLQNIAWHNKGDYLATLSKNSQGKSQVYIHSISRFEHQTPFSKIKGNINTFSFHPNKPYFLVATNSNIFVYNLQKQELVRKFVSNLNTITYIAIHKNGDNILAGSKDGKVAWFQLDLSEKPYKMMDYHGDKIKSVAFHNNFPLFLSASRNGKLVIYHATIYDDLIQDPLIVPLKVLKPLSTNSIITSSCFHPSHPWMFSSGEDNLIRLWS